MPCWSVGPSRSRTRRAASRVCVNTVSQFTDAREPKIDEQSQAEVRSSGRWAAVLARSLGRVTTVSKHKVLCNTAAYMYKVSPLLRVGRSRLR